MAVSHALLRGILHHSVIGNATTSKILNFNPFPFLERVSQNKVTSCLALVVFALVTATLVTPTLDNAMAEAAALKLPSLWTNDLETWFIQAEAQFCIRKITSETKKYHHVLAVLSAETAAKVKDIIRDPPQDAYTALKTALLRKYEPTEYERAAAIMGITSLGDYKPSDLMDRFLNLLGGHEGGILLRYHFLRLLPDYVRSALSLSTAKDLRKLAAQADCIFLAGRDTQSIFTASQNAEIDRVQRRQDSPRKTTSSSPGWCFYHSRFGDKARKCVSPCTWQGNGPSGQQQ